jgi:hypothetical protein
MFAFWKESYQMRGPDFTKTRNDACRHTILSSGRLVWTGRNRCHWECGGLHEQISDTSGSVLESAYLGQPSNISETSSGLFLPLGTVGTKHKAFSTFSILWPSQACTKMLKKQAHYNRKISKDLII